MIREFVASDMDSVLRIWLESSVKAHDFVDRAFWESKLDDMRNIYIPASETYVYESGREVKGFFSLHGDTLAAMFVAPGCQGEGIGQQLMTKVKSLRKRITLGVYKENEQAVEFYKRCGFQEVSERRDSHIGYAELVMQLHS
ncbi:GNAT family N-acetyltransferase [Halomonas campisalis]|uniref:GNAT family N-acetyltransferase n=1 Tax=Billgrantia campisalis TaxID=74661 RepID=A0ABS9P888_9GAMM|nr:GNAT family N-acetyltransferase [Halomonas campisalis]MCG6657988.1 GNAT family N-acetyltransferase [Halomonas campisalis]MDR5864821.1 GNAT family N-acetyltransferase [Halomonas campisalis]